MGNELLCRNILSGVCHIGHASSATLMSYQVLANAYLSYPNLLGSIFQFKNESATLMSYQVLATHLQFFTTVTSNPNLLKCICTHILLLIIKCVVTHSSYLKDSYVCYI